MIDAALNAPGHGLWLFKGASYWLMDQASGQLQRGPLPLAQWASDSGGLPEDFVAGIDAACWAGPSFPHSFYIFRGSRFLRLDHPAFDAGQAAAQVADGTFERALQVTESDFIGGIWCCDDVTCWLTHSPSAAVHAMRLDEVGSIHFFDGVRCLRHGLSGEGLIGSPDATSLEHWNFPRHGGLIDLAFWDNREGNKNLFLVSGLLCARYDALVDELREVRTLDQMFPALWQLSEASGQYLAVRRQDLAVVSLRWTGMTPRDGNRLEATDDDASLVVSLAPQAIGEQVVDVIEGQAVASTQPRFKSLAAPSQLALAMPRGTVVGLELSELLATIERGRVRTAAPAKGHLHTMLDMPSGLLWWPRPAVLAEVGVQSMRPAPTDPSAAWPMWRVEVRSRDSTAGGNAGLTMQTWTAMPDPKPPPLLDPPTMALPFEMRRRIVDLARPDARPAVQRLRLSSAGGDLRVSGDWPDLTWVHDLQFGRDQYVFTQTRGRLFPFGHRATLTTVTTRELIAPPPPAPPRPPPAPPPFPPAPQPVPPFPHPRPPLMDGPTPAFDLARAFTSPLASAGLVQRSTLVVEEPACSTLDASGQPARTFPFDAVTLLETVFEGVDPAATGGALIGDANGLRRFEVQLAHPTGDLSLALPLAFVPDGDALSEALAEQWAAHAAATLPGVTTDLLRMPQPSGNDLIELHALRWAPQVDGAWVPQIGTVDAVLPALRALELGLDGPQALSFNHSDSRAPLRLLAKPTIDFVKKAGRSGGLITPRYAVDAVSRELGPVAHEALNGLRGEALRVFENTRLLGLPLSQLIADVPNALPPKLEPLRADGRVVGGKMTWTVPLKNTGPLVVERDMTRLDLQATVDARGSDVTCTLNDVSYELPGKLLTIGFSRIVWHQPPAAAATLDLQGVKLAFGGELALLKDLLDKAMQLLRLPGGLRVRKQPRSVVASWDFPIPEASCVSFVLRGVALRLAVEVPLDDRPVTASLGFSSREKPFSLTVLGLGGGGHIALTFGGRETAIEASMEFGALVALNLGIVSAEVHAFGGVRFELVEGNVRFTAYIRIGGSVNLLGLITVALELMVQLTYQDAGNCLIGQASIVIEVDLTLFSESFRLDSGEWKLCGGADRERRALRRADPAFVREQWLRYQETFA